jgi:two-component system, NarL family, nitrate/nitrite response regulator NarL
VELADPMTGDLRMTASLRSLTIGIIDSNPLLANGISALMRQDGEFSPEISYLGETVEAFKLAGRFDVVLVDPAQIDDGPVALVKALIDSADAIVAYCSSASNTVARSCISAGFRGVLPKTVSFDVLKIALATVASGGVFIDAAFATAIAPDSGAEDPPEPIREARLSDRELFVLKSVAHGKSLKEIGRELDLSCKTVETYKARGTSKLNLSGRRQIVEFAIAQGWVAVPPQPVARA